jgi:ATP-binding cassette subfamily B protein
LCSRCWRARSPISTAWLSHCAASAHCAACGTELYGHIQRLPYAWHVSIQTGDIIQRCTSDVEVLRNFLTNQMLELFRTVVLVVAAIAWMFTMSAKLTWVSVAFIPVIIGYSGVFFR